MIDLLATLRFDGGGQAVVAVGVGLVFPEEGGDVIRDGAAHLRIVCEITAFVKYFAHFCFLFVIGSTLIAARRSMEIFVGEDRRDPNVPRAVIQQGRCSENQCGQLPSPSRTASAA